MTAVTPDLTAPVFGPTVAATPAAAPSAVRTTPRWALLAVTGGLMVTMAATTATALVRANTRAHQVTDVKAALADVRASLATTQTDLASARGTVADLREALSATKDENAALMACTDSLLTFIDRAIENDIPGAARALRGSNCDAVLGDASPLGASANSAGSAVA